MMFMNGFLVRYTHMYVFHSWGVKCIYMCVAELYNIMDEQR